MLALWLGILVGCSNMTERESCEENYRIECGCGELTDRECTDEGISQICSDLSDSIELSDNEQGFNECIWAEREDTCESTSCSACYDEYPEFDAGCR